MTMWVAKMMVTCEVMCTVMKGKVMCKVIVGGWGMMCKAQGRSRTAKVQWQST